MMRKVILYVGSLLAIVSFAACIVGSERGYFKKEFRYKAITRIEPKRIRFDDLIPSDTLFACYTSNPFPHAYYREVFTNVCNGGECLPVWLYIYWSPGGAYLGYSLKNDNILTKEKHIPFTEADYEQLHQLLDNPQSLLKDYTLKEVEPDDTSQQAAMAKKRIGQYGNYVVDTPVLSGDLLSKWSKISLDSAGIDGVTGATDKEVKLFVVKGALYTTYTLWHIIYGASQDSIRALSLRDLSPQFLDTLLYSNNIEDNRYALSIMGRFDKNVVEKALPKLQTFILSDNFLLKEKAMDVLRGSEVSDETVQKIFSTLFVQSDFGTKQMLIDRLSVYTYLSPESLHIITENFSKENSILIQKIFKLLQKQNSIDTVTKMNIASLLDNPNSFISKMAYKFLSNSTTNEDKVNGKLQRYVTKNRLTN